MPKSYDNECIRVASYIINLAMKVLIDRLVNKLYRLCVIRAAERGATGAFSLGPTMLGAPRARQGAFSDFTIY